MGIATKIMRSSLHAFLKHYHPAASAAALLMLPFSAAALLSRSPALFPPPLLSAASGRLRRVFVAAGFPPASQLLLLLNSKLSLSIFSFLATLPFSLTFLLLSKACTVQFMHRRHATPTSLRRLYQPLLQTQCCNLMALLFANAAVFSLLVMAFSAAEAMRLASGHAVLALSAAGVVAYSVAIANAAAVCNLATVAAAAEGRGGHRAVLRALLLVRGHAATAVAVSLPASLGAAAVEGLFQLRVVRAYSLGAKVGIATVCEGLLVAYIYSMICVLDTVITCMVYKTCKASHGQSCDLLELEGKGEVRD